MEYTILSLIAVALSFYYALFIVKLDSKLLVVTCFISVLFQLLFDNYMTSLGLWIFDYSFTLGIMVPIIPIENLLFGISLAAATVASWEALKK